MRESSSAKHTARLGAEKQGGKMTEAGEWPIPWKDLIVTLEDGREMMAIYTGSGWLFNTPLFIDFGQSTVVSYRYLKKED